jgi:hypothetical protein
MVTRAASRAAAPAQRMILFDMLVSLMLACMTTFSTYCFEMSKISSFQSDVSLSVPSSREKRTHRSKQPLRLRRTLVGRRWKRIAYCASLTGKWLRYASHCGAFAPEFPGSS